MRRSYVNEPLFAFKKKQKISVLKSAACIYYVINV